MIILMGVAGAGKSMQGRLFADEHGFAWISTGELLRVLVTGKRRHEMLEGKLLSDDEMVHILDKVLDLINTSDEFVLDGFPRTIPQAEWILTQAEHGRFDIDIVFNLVASQNLLRTRLRARGRIDDTDEAIAQRFKEYEEVTRPIMDLLRARGIHVYDIDASKTPQEVHDALLSHVNGLHLTEAL
jgi:adenylate kinase